MHNTAPIVQNKTTQPWWNNHCCQRSLPIPIASCWVRLRAAANENVADWPLAPEDWRQLARPWDELKNSCGCYSQLWMSNKHSNIKLDDFKKGISFFQPSTLFFQPSTLWIPFKNPSVPKFIWFFHLNWWSCWSLVFPRGVYHAWKR